MKYATRRLSHFGSAFVRMGAALTVVAAGLAAVALFTPGKVQAQAVTQSYSADTTLQSGMFVRLDTTVKTKIVSVTQKEAGKTYGVVVQPNDAPLSLSDDNTAQKYYVATTGSYKVLVSDQQGAIKKGDFLVISSYEGIAMRADDSQQYAVAKALDNFDGTGSAVSSQANLKDSKGGERTVHFGYINADISVARNPLLKESQDGLPSFLRRASEAIADKQVTALRVYIGAVIAIITAIIVIIMLYAGIRTSITSLGRNPLARGMILRNLFSIIIGAIIILIIGMFAVYLLLKL